MKRTYRNVLDAVARPYVKDEVDLFPNIAAQLEKKTYMRPLYARPVLVVLMVLLALGVLTGVVYAVGKSLGYIPGVGIVDQTVPLRGLSKPVTVEREGITLTVSNVVLAADKTVVLFSVENVPGSAYPQVANQTDGCSVLPELHLLDGTVLPFVGGGAGLREITLTYAAIPADVDEAVFVMPCIMATLPGLAPENWEVRLHFGAAPLEMTVVPVIEIVPTITVVSPVLEDVPAVAEPPFVVTNTMIIGEEVVLLGATNQLDDGARVELRGWRLLDANGEEVFTSHPMIEDLPNTDWGLQFNASEVAFPVTLALDWLRVETIADSYVEFEFDVGENPTVPQEWTPNLPLEIGGHTLTLTRLLAVSQSDYGGYSFKFTASPADVTGVSLEIDGYAALGAGGGGGGGGTGQISASFIYPELPKGKLRIILSDLRVAGPLETWVLAWQPESLPLVEAQPPTEESGACLTFENWNQLQGQVDPLSAALAGKVLTTVNEGGPLLAIYLSSLDGDRQKIEVGAWPALSADGTQLAYSAADGLHVIELASGQNTALGLDGHRIIWSPDSTRMIFTTSANLQIINADGSGLQTVDVGAAQLIVPVGWLPDGQSIVYSVMRGPGFELERYNLQSGETEALFTIYNKAGFAAISPDGQTLAFADRTSNLGNWEIFISRLDGSERKLVADAAVPTAFAVVWSPDGQWLIINTRTREGLPMPVLVNPFSCQTDSLNIDGFVEGWSP